MGTVSNAWNRIFHSKRINFLGLKSSGKTQLLCSLGAKGVIPGVESHGEDYKSFSFRYEQSNKKKFIKCGIDYGGGLSVFRANFTRLIKKGDYIFFVIDINEFLNNTVTDEEGYPYQEAVLARLDIINDTVTNVEKDKVHIILTHTDLKPEFTPNKLIDMFTKYTHDKPYHVLTKNCRAVDARDSAMVKRVFFSILDS